MHDVVQDAIRLYISNRENRMGEMFARIVDDDAPLIDRLGQ